MNQIIEQDGDFDCTETVDFSIRNGKVVPVYNPQARPTPKGVGFVDQLSFTFLNEFYRNFELRHRVACWGGGTSWGCEDEIVRGAVDAILGHVFGVKVGAKRPVGLNFYKSTFALEDNAGMVSIGGQGGTILVQLTGMGISIARKGWEKRLQKLSEILQRFVITRVDVAYDDIEGRKYSTDQALIDYQDGLYTCGGRWPSCEQRGNWIFPDGKGRTFYVGRRENGKLLRVYEKGRQLGEAASPWVRVELELHNKDRLIPFEILLRPGAYLAGAYPALEWVAEGNVTEKIKTLTKVLEITYDNAVKHLVRSYGGLLKMISEVESEGLAVLVPLFQDRPEPRRVSLPLSALILAG